MATCPAGHDSAAADFCDVCGMRIGRPHVPASSSVASPSAAAPSPATGAPDAAAEPCPQCGGAKSGRFCEACGFDFTAGQSPRRTAAGPPVTAPPGSAAWTAVVTADRAYFDSVVAADGPDAATLEFPAYCPERRFLLSGGEMRIGRRSVSRGLEPEIDLTGPPTDPGLSHLHAVLIAGPDGNWAVLDPGSANGTQVNGSDIAAGVRVPLHSGDRVSVGAWTVLTIRAG
jgi:FHA domain